ncbi:ATP-binding protein [Phenylobacterium montanum]|uniref:histidine kinase n=1 Tax=Phenylobacterium montanum TaxID=2823693 RepID=A0A975G1I9_9CAUL|nr:ATP-binding protein [Caulobacter sp. S6]QUD89074.1 response regulator [Caulobacter sp. S6]
MANRMADRQLTNGDDRGLWTRVVIVAGLVFCLTFVSLLFRRQLNDLSAIWPANAIVVAVLLRSQKAWWPSLLLAGLLANVAAKLIAGNALAPVVVLPVCNSLENLVCAWAALRLTGGEVDLTQPRQLRGFALAAGVIAPLSAALASGLLLSLWRGDPLLGDVLDWWAMDALGLLTITPALLVATPQALRELWARFRARRGVLSLVLLGISLAAVFGQSRYQVYSLIPASLVLVAFELHLTGAALALLCTAAVSIILTHLGHLPAGAEAFEPAQRVLMLRIYFAATTALVLPIASALTNRARLMQELEHRQGETQSALERLAVSEARYRVLADRTVDIIAQFDLDGVVRYVSPSVAQLGYRPEDLVGRTTQHLVHPDNAREAAARLSQLAGGEIPASGVAMRLRRADGSFVWLEGNPSPITDEAGRVIGVVSVLRDITERRRMEDELRRRTIEAEAASVAKSQFLANMSHEIRTPLTAVIGFTGLLEAEPELSGRSRTFVDRIRSGGEALLDIVNDILDFSKMEAGQIQLAPHAFAPAALLREAVDLVSRQATAKGLSLNLSIGAAPDFVHADSARLRQVVLNLLTNAIKFTQKGEVELSAAYDPASQQLRVAVRDTGEGVSAADQRRLFQRFSQLDGSNTRLHGGTGLGLAICKNLVDLMAGRIGVDSVEGVGSTFWFEVPAPPAQEPAPAGAVFGASGSEDRPANILIVDDMSTNRELVRAILEAVGHRVDEAASGPEAIDAAAKTRFDVILMDMQMPGMDGLAATRAIRNSAALSHGAPIVALSANVLEPQIEACLEAGMDDHLAKPIVPAKLLQKVAQWTGEAA